MMTADYPTIRTCSVAGLALAALMSLTSCETTNSGMGGSSAYGSNGPIDGGYNPYPNGGGGVPAGSLLASGNSHPQYAEAPPAPPIGYEPPPAAAPSKPKVATSKPSTTSSKPVSKTVASTSKPSASKPKTSSSSSVASKPKPKPTSKKSGGGTHVVVSGDSLWAIARKNDTTVAKLKAANGLTSDKLKLGLKLKLP